MFCKQCGSELDSGAMFCRNCGTSVENSIKEGESDNSQLKNLKQNESTKRVISDNKKENPNIKKRKKNKTKVILCSLCVVIVVIILYYIFDSEETYMDTVSITENSFSGAEFNISFNDVKDIISNELNITESNSQSGWEKNIGDDSDIDNDIYVIGDNNGEYAVRVIVNQDNDKVIGVAVFTKYDISSDSSSLEKISNVFSKLSGQSVNDIEDEYSDLADTKKASYDSGIFCSVSDFESGMYEVEILAMSEEYKNQ